MRATIPVFLALTKSWLRSKSGIFFSFLFPVMLLLIFSTVFGGEMNPKYTLYIQNRDIVDGETSNLSRAFIEALNSVEVFKLNSLPPDINITNFVKENPQFENYRILIIPYGFQNRTINKSIAIRLGVITDTFDFLLEKYGNVLNESAYQNITRGKEEMGRWQNATNTSGAALLLLTMKDDSGAYVVKGVIESVANAFNNRLIGAEENIKLATQSLLTGRLRAVDYYLPGYIAAFIMTNGIIGATTVISEYRREGTVKRLAATPLPKSSWVLANVLQQAFLAFLLTGFMILLAWAIFNVRALPDLLAIMLIFVGAVAFCSIGMVLGGVFRDVEAATGVGNAIAFPMMFLSGAFWPIEIMPAYLQSVAKTLPLYYFHTGLRNIMIQETYAFAHVPFLVLGIIAIIFLFLAVKITKWKDF